MKKLHVIYLTLFLILIFGVLISTSSGAISYSFNNITNALKVYFSGNELSLNQRILLDIRIPRVVLAILVGGILGLGGTLLQALFRNPIVEPGMIGTTNGAAAGAALFFVLGQQWLSFLGEWALPIMAFTGGLTATMLVLILARGKNGSTPILQLLLIGIAINAICLSAVGLMSYWARDPQARSITFWSLGTLSGASWKIVILIAIISSVGLFCSLFISKKLDTLLLGEQEAHYLGVNVQRVRMLVILINVLSVSMITAFTGVISFVGLIVPHFLRIIYKTDHQYLIIGSFLLGGSLICISDWACRTLIAPAEIPISILTSLIGVPVFIYLLKNNKYEF